MNRIADLRSTVKSMAEAVELFRQWVLTTKVLAVAKARVEKRIAELKQQHLEANSGRLSALAEMRERLVAYINANRNQFHKPRTYKDELGEFGLRTATELHIADEAALLQDLMEKGYDDCYETVHRPLAKAIRKRMKDGERFPGCTLNSGDTAVCIPSKALIDEACREAIEE